MGIGSPSMLSGSRPERLDGEPAMGSNNGDAGGQSHINSGSASCYARGAEHRLETRLVYWCCLAHSCAAVSMRGFGGGGGIG
jgi:hypothetical protein